MTDTHVDVDTFRQEARAWIQANLEPRHGAPRPPRRRHGDAVADAL